MMDPRYMTDEQRQQQQKSATRVIFLISLLIFAFIFIPFLMSGLGSNALPVFLFAIVLIGFIVVRGTVRAANSPNRYNNGGYRAGNNFNRSFTNNQQQVFGQDSLNNGRGNNFSRSSSKNEKAVFGQNSLNNNQGNNFSRSFSKNEKSVFSTDPLKHASLASQVCPKCYTALDKNGNCPQCSFK